MTRAGNSGQSLDGKVIVVTGGASGIGRELCLLAGRAGASVGVIDLNADMLGTLSDELAREGIRGTIVKADVRDLSAITAAIRRLEADLGPVDILVAGAGVTGTTLVDELKVDSSQTLLEVNYLGVVNTINAALPDMLARGSGQIVGISSMVACRGLPFTAAYCASKSAIAVYLESVRGPLRERGVFVTVVFPGYVRTPLTEAGAVKPPLRVLEPQDAAQRILHAVQYRQRLCRFPFGLSVLVRCLQWLPARTYDRVMTRAASLIHHLRY